MDGHGWTRIKALNYKRFCVMSCHPSPVTCHIFGHSAAGMSQLFSTQEREFLTQGRRERKGAKEKQQHVAALHNREGRRLKQDGALALNQSPLAFSSRLGVLALNSDNFQRKGAKKAKAHRKSIFFTAFSSSSALCRSWGQTWPASGCCNRPRSRPAVPWNWARPWA